VRPCANARFNRAAREPAQLGVGAEDHHVDAGDHLRDVLVRDVRQLRLAQLGKRRVGPVAQEQELEMVLPHQVAEAKSPGVCVEGFEKRGVALLAERDVVGLILRQVGNP
jgi:hypothetical protein